MPDLTKHSWLSKMVQFAYYEVRDEKGYLTFQDHDTTRDGYYFTNGKGIHVNWKKSGDYDPTKFYDDDGNEIELNTGKTMICVVEEGIRIKLPAARTFDSLPAGIKQAAVPLWVLPLLRLTTDGTQSAASVVLFHFLVIACHMSP